MRLVDVSLASELGLERGSAAVCIPVFGAVERFAECLHSVLRTTPSSVRILVADDATPDPGIRALLGELEQVPAHEHVVYYLRQPGNVGFVENVNRAFDLLAPADVIVLNSDCVVSDEWWERLRAAAYSNTRIATASTLSNSATILSVPCRNRPAPSLPPDWSFRTAAAAVARDSLQLRPSIPTTVGHCMYVRRTALELVGSFDLAFSPGYSEEVDFAQRCLAHGLDHVAADDVLVLHYGSASFLPGGGTNARQKAHHEIVRSRYPYYDKMVAAAADDETSPLARALSVAARALRGTSVTIDARVLGQVLTGTQIHTLEVIAAVHATAGVRLRVLLPIDAGHYATDLLAELADVEVIVGTDLPPGLEPSDIVHRPHQVSSLDDLDLLRSLGHRIVITHQDLIAFHNPAYFPSFADWDEHKQLTRHALEAADRVVFFSRHAAQEAVGDELVTQDRARVIYIGTDHRLASLLPAPVAPDETAGFAGRPFLLCIGTDFKHKNRLFALRLLRALREEQGWEGTLVFAGPHVTRGASAGEEAAYLALHPELETHVVDLAAVDEPGKAWLFAHAAAILYPTTYEGFGLVPYEAVAAGVPCLFAAQTSIAELLSESLATIVPWDESATAARARPLLDDGPERTAHIAGIAATAARLTWARTGRQLVDTYLETARQPQRMGTELVLQDVDHRRCIEELTEANERLTERLEEIELHADHLQHQLNQKLDRLNPVDRALVDPDGPIPEDVRRPLLAIGSRRAFRILVFGPLRLAYRIGRVGKVRRELPAPEDA